MAAPASALFYLWWRSLANVILARLRRLRQPKYLFGALVGIGYFYFLFNASSFSRRGDGEGPVPPGGPGAFFTVAPVLMLALCLLVWTWRRKRTALQFSAAEVAYLFAGPVSHGTLVHYALLRQLATLLFSAFFFVIISGGWQLQGSLWARFIGWWILLSVVSLHVTASGFVLTRLLNRGIAQWQRQGFMLALVLVTVWLVGMLDPHLRGPTLSELEPALAWDYLLGQVGSGVPYWILMPFRAVIAPLAAPDLSALARALPAALLIQGLHYVWAYRSEVPDAEESLAMAAKRDSIMAAVRKGNLHLALVPPKSRPDPFKLAPHGTPVVAFLWKNLLSTREYLNLRTLLALALAMVVWDLWQQTPPRYPLAFFLTLGLAVIVGSQTLLFGVHLARQDLRSDMENADVMKTWPLAGWQIVLGQLLAPAAILTGVLWLCVLQLGLLADLPSVEWWTTELRIVSGISVALVLPFLCGMQLLVTNAAAVLYPAWLKPSGAQHPGFEVGIQRLIFFLGLLLVMVAALLPGLLFGAIAYIPLSWFLGLFAILPAAIVTALVLAGELAWGINWLGERFEDYDLSA